MSLGPLGDTKHELEVVSSLHGKEGITISPHGCPLSGEEIIGKICELKERWLHF